MAGKDRVENQGTIQKGDLYDGHKDLGDLGDKIGPDTTRYTERRVKEVSPAKRSAAFPIVNAVINGIQGYIADGGKYGDLEDPNK